MTDQKIGNSHWITFYICSTNVEYPSDVITGGMSSATSQLNATVTSRTVNPEFIGVSTGAAIIGAYGIGFAKAGEANLFDLSSKKIMSTATTKDTELRRPRPLMMKVDKDGIRVYKGKDYFVVRPR